MKLNLISHDHSDISLFSALTASGFLFSQLLIKTESWKRLGGDWNRRVWVFYIYSSMQARDYFVQCQQIQNAEPSIVPLHILHPVFSSGVTRGLSQGGQIWLRGH